MDPSQHAFLTIWIVSFIYFLSFVIITYRALTSRQLTKVPGYVFGIMALLGPLSASALVIYELALTAWRPHKLRAA